MNTYASVTPQQSDLTPTTSVRRDYRLLKRLTIVALALACANPLSLNLVDPDLWGHVQYGQDWLAEGALPRTASHTFTAVDHPWINHENLAELAFALGYQYLGVPGLLIVKCLCGMSILLAMAWVAHRHQVHAFVAWPLMLLVALNLQMFFLLRPQLLSFALCAITLVLLDRSFCDWHESQRIHWRKLGWLPLVFLVWTNAHGGFVLGLAVVGAYLGGRIVEAVLADRINAWPRVLAMSVLGIVCIAVTFVNPYGFELHRWLMMSLGEPRPEITEWAPPKISDPIFWQWITLLAVTAVSLLATRRRRDWVHVAIMALVAWQSAMHLRHIAFLALLCGFWLPVHVQSVLARLRPTSELPPMGLSPWFKRFAVAALLLAIGLQSLALKRLWSDFPVKRDHYPVDAFQFMVDHNLHGNLVVSFNWAQYAIAALSPETRVAFDGRFRTCYPQEVVDMHFDFLAGEYGGKRNRSPKSGEVDGTRVLEHGSPDLVLVDLRYDHALQVMQNENTCESPRWVLLYSDSIAQLWGRSDRYDDPTFADYLPVTSRILSSKHNIGVKQWPALPVRNKKVGDEATQLANSEFPKTVNHVRFVESRIEDQ